MSSLPEAMSTTAYAEVPVSDITGWGQMSIRAETYAKAVTLAV
ncbi:hypothetical protein [Nostoc sp.]